MATFIRRSLSSGFVASLSLLLAGKTHFTANRELGPEGDKTGPRFLEFIREVTR